MTNHFNVFLSALLVYLSFPNVFNIDGFWPLAWIALLPLMKALEGRSPGQRAAIGILYGTSLYSFLLSWLFGAHPAGAVLFIVAMAVQPVLFALFYTRKLQTLTGTTSWASIIYVAALWAATEWVRALMLGGFAWGISYSQSFNPALIQLASASGLYGVSFVIVMVNVLVGRAIAIKTQRRLMLALAFTVFISVYMSGMWRLSRAQTVGTSLKVCAVQPNISPHKKSSHRDFDENIRLHLDLTERSVSKREPDVIVWPETAFPADIFKDGLWYPRLRKVASDNNALFVFGAVPVADGKNYNSAVMLDRNGGLAGVYDKRFLVPASEYKPGGLMGKLLSPLFDRFGFDFTPGDRLGIFSGDGGKLRFGIMICSETCYPALARALASGGAGWLLAILNDGWFSRPEAVMMHAQNAVFRAVESGRDVVSVGNTGWTGVVNGHGMMRKEQQLSLQQESQGTFVVSSRPKSTLYGKFGDFFAGACGLFVIMHLFFNRLTRNPS